MKDHEKYEGKMTEQENGTYKIILASKIQFKLHTKTTQITLWYRRILAKTLLKLAKRCRKVHTHQHANEAYIYSGSLKVHVN